MCLDLVLKAFREEREVQPFPNQLILFSRGEDSETVCSLDWHGNSNHSHMFAKNGLTYIFQTMLKMRSVVCGRSQNPSGLRQLRKSTGPARSVCASWICPPLPSLNWRYDLNHRQLEQLETKNVEFVNSKFSWIWKHEDGCLAGIIMLPQLFRVFVCFVF